MNLLLHDVLATAPLVHPFVADWITPPFPVEARAAFSGEDVDAETAALIPTGDLPALMESHRVSAAVAVVSEGSGLISMRVPVRPDEVDRTNVRLYETSSTAALLARATLQPFYGIQPLAYGADFPDAQVVIVEDAEALRPAEAGFSEDLVRAWFILTGQPVVTHVLAIPAGADADAIVDAMRQARSIGHERRKEVRAAAADRFGLERAELVELYARMRWELNAGDRRALTMLLQHGNKGAGEGYVWNVPFLDASSG